MLLDLQMPDVSGWDVLGAVRADRRLNGPAVVVCYLLDARQGREEALRQGAQDYLVKYGALDRLEVVVGRYAGRAAAAAAPGPR